MCVCVCVYYVWRYSTSLLTLCVVVISAKRSKKKETAIIKTFALHLLVVVLYSLFWLVVSEMASVAFVPNGGGGRQLLLASRYVYRTWSVGLR